MKQYSDSFFKMLVPCSQIRNSNCLDSGCHQLGEINDEKDHEIERAIRSVPGKTIISNSLEV